VRKNEIKKFLLLNYFLIFVVNLKLMKSTHKLKEISKWKLGKISLTVSKFCLENLGYNRKIGVPTIKISYKDGDVCWGEYNPHNHQVVIFINNLKTLSDLTSTIIHEWTHSNQDVLGKYVKLYKKFGYDNHPMEIEAYANEKIWNRKCLAFLRKK